jgi:hypothetical protein
MYISTAFLGQIQTFWIRALPRQHSVSAKYFWL